MLGSTILDVAVGVIFIFILVSIICSGIREGLESLLKTRAANLEHGIRELLHDRRGEGLARDFFTHPLIAALYEDEYEPGASARGKKRPWALARGGKLPSYIPSQSFAVALMDLAVRGRTQNAAASSAGSPRMTLDNLRENVEKLDNPQVQRALLTAIDSAQGDLNRVQANLQAWFDSSMDRVSGWYKRSTHRVLFVIGLFVAVFLNVDTIAIADHLYHDDAARAALVARAIAAAQRPDSAAARRDSAAPATQPAADSAATTPSVANPAAANGPLVPPPVNPLMALQKGGAATDSPPASKSATATTTSQPPPADSATSEYTRALAALDSLPLPIGWTGNRADRRPVICEKQGDACEFKKFWVRRVLPVFGWLITALAATLGAPFWFDVLNKVMVIRSTVKPYEKSPPEDSEDRQIRRPAAQPAAPVAPAAAGVAGAGAGGAAGVGVGVAGGAGVAGGGAVPPAGLAPPDDDVMDPEADLDGCSVETVDPTPDEELPPAHGGVA